MSIHKTFMQRCINLAKNGSGTTTPNPMVGAVVVHNGVIIGEGWHQKAGSPHAEVNAINSVKNKSLLAQSSIYVSLEPCSHTGKTPPCADLIITHKIPTVYVGCFDPNPAVAGSGIKKLRAAGAEVFTGILEAECTELNKKFFTFHQQKRPFVTLKWAKTSDGFIDKKRENAERGQFAISSPESKVFVHQLRVHHDAVLVGSGTAFTDNPKLNARFFEGKTPVRLVLDRFLKLPADLELFTDEIETWRFSTVGKNVPGTKRTVVLHEKEFLKSVLHYCHTEGVQSILVEGGAAIFSVFLQANLWDEIIEIKSSKTIGEGLSAPTISMPITKTGRIGADELILYKNNGLPAV